MDSEKKELMYSTYRQFMEIGLGNGDSGYLQQIVDEKITGFGTAIDEKIQGIEEVIHLLEIQTAQSKAFDISWRVVPVSHYTTADEDTAVFADDVYLTIKAGEKTIDMYLRFSSVLNYIDGQWKVIHWHGSKPEQVESKKDTWGVDIWKQKAEELERLVDEKTADLLYKNRELQIEAALEKVRTVAMGMQSPEDMMRICTVISQQLAFLGLLDIRNVQTAIFHPERGTYMNYEYYARHDKTLATEVAYQLHPIQQGFAQKMMKGPGEELREHLEGKALQDWYAYQQTTNQFADDHLLTADSLNYYWFSLGPVALGISTYAPMTRDETDLFRRFMKVFELAYQRYLDIEKAFAQAKEAQIEAALERVRARSMAMRSSEELTDVISLLLDQIRRLDVPAEHAGFYIEYKQRDDWHIWLADPNQIPYELTVPYFECPLWGNYNKAKAQGLEAFAKTYSFDEKNDFYEKLFNLFPVPDEARTFYLQCPDLSVSTVLLDTVGLYVENFSGTPYTEEDNRIVKRFGTVFQQTYTRFLDLQKAETQAREAQIEAALESIRSKAMAMRTSEDIAETTAASFTELKKLGISSFRSGVGILTKGSKMAQVFADTRAEDGQTRALTTMRSMDEHPALQQQYIAWEKQEDYEQFLSGDELTTYYSHPFFQKSNIDLQKKNEQGQECGYYFAFPDGLFYSWSHQPYTESEKSILRRFRNIISLTFRRYLDLQKAEAQAREATKQASLDRVRAVIASMRSTKDLELITPLMFQELTTLGVPFIRCGVFIIHEDWKIIDAYLSSPTGASLGALHLPFDASELTVQTVEAWRKKQVHRQHWNQEDFVAWTTQMMEQHQIESSRTYQGADSAPESLDLHFVPFSQGMIYVGSMKMLGDQELELVLALAKSFSIAYARYEDFVKLETAKASIESTLTELKATQAQLIQQEKLASLGQLTAGIAHEIQNPLNFVNNFSEINAELSEEILDAAAKGDLDEIRNLAADIKHNQEKIREHGQRADAIVKGMLQHSRSGTGVKELTDLNKLADEYLRLAYHGMRAKEKDFNVSIETDFDHALPHINVIPQEIGRVILNLVNNAFYATQEKSKAANQDPDAQFQPGIVLRTRNHGNNIEISVKDNGNGIPSSIKDKIFQPFFTTKPTGRGTGLGLSLSYDTIKSHGGEIKVNATEGEGSEFIIHLRTT